MSIEKFIADNGFPVFDLTKTPNTWHKLEDANFKGAYIHRSASIGKKTVSVVTVYNYRSGVSVTERIGTEELNKVETARLQKIIEEQEQEAQKERVRKHEQCKVYANEQFPTFTEVDLSANPYLARKLSKALSGEAPNVKCYQRTTIMGETDLIAPFCDIKGTLWNYQTITEKGDKQILIGGKYQGLFIPILPSGKYISDIGSFNKVYLVEGYSTGLSVFLALGEKFPVLCAISSTNILNVASEVRRKYEKLPIIICADNDCWKHNHENTGEVAAIECVSRVDGTAYGLPDFSGCTETQLASKPTDYNDLLNLRGIDEVRRQVEQIAISRPRIIYALGYNQKNYYFTTSKVPQIQSITDFSETDILRLAPLSYWEARFPKERGAGFDQSRVKDHLIELCQDAGLFEATRLRGRGIYSDQGKMVQNLGDKLKFLETGVETDLADIKSTYYYDPRPRWAYEGEEPSENLIPSIYSCLSKFAWSSPFESMLCLGWLLTTPLSGCLDWRSHLAVTAEAGTGKTTLLNGLNSILSGFMPLKAEGMTEAGLRQSLGSDAIPVILDEQDTNSLDPKAFDRIMTLFRMASSEGEVRRGTPSGKMLKFNACFSGLIAGINLPKMKHADLTRFCIIELNPNNKTQSWAAMSEEIKMMFQTSTAKQFYTWVIRNIEPMQKYIREIAPLIEEKSDARTAQQYSNLIGAAAYALGIEKTEAVKMLAAYWNRGVISVTELGKDSDGCLDHLLDLVVIQDEDRRSISLSRALEKYNEPEAILAQFNMKVVDGKLFVPSTNPLLARHFEKTPWPNWSKSLLRIKDSSSKVVKLGGRSVRGVLVPVEIPAPAF